MCKELRIPEITDPEMTRFCPVCDHFAPEFESFGVVKRPDSKCPNCKTLERYRLLYLYLFQETDFFEGQYSVLDIGPLEGFSQVCRGHPNLKYISIDLISPKAMVKMDARRLGIANESMNCVICYHILEHIPDDHVVLAELFRVLKPKGKIFLQVPINIDSPKTFYDPLTAPEDREKVYGQKDHVRIYGNDFQTYVEQAGFQVQRISYVNKFTPDQQRLMGLKNTYRLSLYRTCDDIFVAEKPVALAGT